MAIVTIVAIIQALPGIAGGHDPARTGFELTSWLIQAALQFVLLSMVFERAVQRKLASLQLIVGSFLLAVFVGVSLSVLTEYVGQSWLGIEMGPPRPPPDHHPHFPGPPPFRLMRLSIGGIIGLFTCGVWALAFVLPYLSEASRRQAMDAERLALETAQLRAAWEIASLRAKLEPHFLLNTLNTIAGLVTLDPVEARRLIGCLGDLLRDVPRDQDEMQPLSAEISWLQRYAEILAARHGDALTFDWDVPEETNALLIPRLLLQPLVENAVRHGALRRERPGRVSVRIRMESSASNSRKVDLVCVVADNGPGLPTALPREGAFGLHSVRQRLRLLSSEASLTLHSGPTGTQAIVRLPIHD